ncbi:zinc-binding dehydrogenase [Paenarthrobacter sp. NPDC089316]|uniref:zinc-binding dehydrogenase n=1 Tax=unclassified Paenarthrobacter TaxID=2634190 RepID=UPI00343FB46B
MNVVPATTRAAVLTEYGANTQVWDLPIPDLDPRGILVTVEAATMCGSDVHLSQGALSDPKAVFHTELPLVLGHEIVGRVAKLGSDRVVDGLNRPLKEGDLIAFTYARCRSCFWCSVAHQPTLCENSVNYGYGPVDEFPYLTGGYSEYAYVMPGCGVVKVPEGLDPALAASATCAFRTVVHGFERVGQLKSTDTVVIQGSGPIGLFAVAYAVQMGVRRTIVIGGPADRLALAQRWGADAVMDFTEVGIEERRVRVLEATEGRGADVVLECSGARGAMEEGVGLARRGGKYLLLGVGAPEKARIDVTDLVIREITVLGSAGGDVDHYYQALQFLADYGDRFPFEAILGNRYGLEDVGSALAAMKNATEIKPVIIPAK